MKKKTHRKGKSSHTKSILRLPDLEVAKIAVINSLSCADAQRGYRHAIDESLSGIALSPGYLSVRLLCFDTECVWNRGTSRPAQSTFVSAPCVASHMKLQTVAFTPWEKSPDTGRLRVAILFSGDLSRVGVTVQRPGNGNPDRDNSN